MKEFSWFFVGVGLFVVSLLFFWLSFFDRANEVGASVKNFFQEESVIPLAESENTNSVSDKNIDIHNPSKVQMEVFYDFTCLHCKDFFTDTIAPLLEDYTHTVEITFSPYPLQTTGKSFEMAKWFLCAQRIKGDEIATSFISQVSAEDDLERVASYLELEEESSKAFRSCIDSEEVALEVIKIRDMAREKGVRGTPTFFLEEEKFERNQPLESVVLYIENALKNTY